MIKYTGCCLDNLYVKSDLDNARIHVDKTSKKLFEIGVGCYLASNKCYLTGKEFKFLRKTAGLKKQKFAELIGTDSYEITQIEAGLEYISWPLRITLKLLFLDRCDTLPRFGLVNFLENNAKITDENNNEEKLIFEYDEYAGWKKSDIN